MELNWSTIITGAVTSVINAVAIFLSTRFVSRAIEKMEKKNKEESK